MSSLFIKLFGKKQISDDELILSWKNSDKTLKNVEDYLMKISENQRLEAFLSNIPLVRIKTLNEIRDLNKLFVKLSQLQGNNIKNITIKANLWNKLRQIGANLSQTEKIYKILDKSGKNEKQKEMFITNFVFGNKYEILLLCIEHYSDLPELMNFLHLIYFSRSSYLDCLKYIFIKFSNPSEAILNFLLPNRTNVEILLENSAVPIQIQLKHLFKNSIGEISTSSSITELIFNLYFNIILHLKLDSLYFRIWNRNESAISIILNQMEFIQDTDNNLIKIRSAMGIYDIYCEMQKTTFEDDLKEVNMNIISFLTNDDCSLLFYVPRFLRIPRDNFKLMLSKLFQSIKLLSDHDIHMKNISLIPYTILHLLVKEKSTIDLLSCFISTFVDSFPSEHDIMRGFLIKLLIEYYSDTLQSNIQLCEILRANNELLKCENLFIDISNSIQFITVFDKHKLGINLLNIIRTDYSLFNNGMEFTACLVLKIVKEYLFKICNNFKMDMYDFIDRNIDGISIICKYFQKYQSLDAPRTYGQLLYLFMEAYGSYQKYIVKILLTNINLNSQTLSSKDLEILIKQFISYKDSISANSTELNEFIEDINSLLKGNKILPMLDKNLEFNLKRLLRYFKVVGAFHQHQLSADLLKEFDYTKINSNIVLEIFIIKTFNVDQIISIKDFISKRPSQEIQRALEIDDNEYLYNLFIFFFKYQRERLYMEIIERLTQGNPKDMFKYLDKCLNHVKASSFSYEDFLEKTKLKLYILENSENVNDLVDFNRNQFEFKGNSPKIQFSLSSNNLGLITMANLAQLNLANEGTDKIYSNLKGIMNQYNCSLMKDDKSDPMTVKEKFKLFLSITQTSITNELSYTNCYKYSLHPKLIDVLKKVGYGTIVKDFHFNIKDNSKIKLYNFLLRGNICCIENILEFENIQINKISGDPNKIFDTLKILLNIYRKETESQVENFLLKNNFIQLPIDSGICEDLITFNINNLRMFKFSHLKFITQILQHKDLNMKESSAENNLLRILSEISPRLIILPFLSVFDNLIKSVKVAEALENFYSDSAFLSNIHFFTEKKFASEIKEKYKLYEIFKNVSLCNFANYEKIFRIFPMFFNADRVNFILIIKSIHIFMNLLSTAHPQQIKNAAVRLMNLIKNLKLNQDDAKLIFNEIFLYPSIPAIYETHSNVLIFEQNLGMIIKNLSFAKQIISEQLLNHFPQMLNIPLFVNCLKVFKIKSYILSQMPDNEIKAFYEKMKTLGQYTDLEAAVKNYEKIQKEIYKIYVS